MIKMINLWEWTNEMISTLPETNSSPLKMDGWNTSFLLGWHIFRGELLVSERVYNLPTISYTSLMGPCR